ncbi:2-amino-4-hydroxy-6-hydroxymethyldihydropteridine diphosphokinase [Actinomadura harenae]|uniref:2-amino-4-hydroxy-6-hydroxymethyldihydropteridine diphosphokinase n=1 Tax=Actinomadura harenae TaxID=2483351 RepID=A0A3M2LBT8_9ACTN|nr:2-amino-4-hydroxy-6-hydroxymethyldihydropteridine diphosphokinase [Actinomadura harenae]RMI34556.1 2-amino-4-hydroxy-6-hydroxymethyldihydropteridine diphosphokinase [Actinomadura harenae]
MGTVFIGLGSNISPDVNLPLAVKALAELRPVTRVSPVYRSTPVGGVNGGDFLNAAAALTYTARDVADLVALKESLTLVEERLGRVPSTSWRPRTIDLDILHTDGLTGPYGEHWEVPHPDVSRFAHVAVPLADIAPDALIGGRRVRDIAAELRAAGPQLHPCDSLRLGEVA